MRDIQGMADVAAFDPLTTFDGLKSAGFTEPQARALTEGLRAAVLTRSAEHAAKSDLVDIRAEIAGLRSDTKREIAELKAELLKALAEQQRWTIGVLGVLMGLMFAALRLT